MDTDPTCFCGQPATKVIESALDLDVPLCEACFDQLARGYALRATVHLGPKAGSDA